MIKNPPTIHRYCMSIHWVGFNPWVRKIPWGRRWQPTPAFLPGESHGQRNLAGYSPRGHKRAHRPALFTERTNSSHYPASLPLSSPMCAAVFLDSTLFQWSSYQILHQYHNGLFTVTLKEFLISGSVNASTFLFSRLSWTFLTFCISTQILESIWQFYQKNLLGF